MTQDQVFLEGEGDRWFLRNKAAVTRPDHIDADPVLTLLELVALTPKQVLEIGASNGYRLQELHRRLNCRVTAVEPSREAIEDGLHRYPAITFLRGSASDIPITESYQFDLVIVHFVFHWIDRSTLLQSVAEIDRMVKDGGFLVVGDFAPAYPERVVYHHLPGTNVWTYKQQYADIFVASNLYERVAALQLDHSSHQIQPDVVPSNRMQVVLLRKSLHERYAISKGAS